MFKTPWPGARRVNIQNDKGTAKGSQVLNDQATATFTRFMGDEGPRWNRRQQSASARSGLRHPLAQGDGPCGFMLPGQESNLRR